MLEAYVSMVGIFYNQIRIQMKQHNFLFIFVLWLCLPLCTFAQSDRNIVFKVAVGDMEYTPKQGKETVGSALGTISKAVLLGTVTTQRDNYASSVRASVLSGFGKVRRFHATEGQFKDGEIKEGTHAFYVTGTINNISTTTELFMPTDKSIKPYNVFKAQIEVVVHLKDVHDGHIVDTHTFYVNNNDLSWVKTEDKAMNEALIILSSKVTKHYNKLYPLSASIVEPGNVKKDKQKDVYIDLGSKDGAVKGMKLTVYSIKTIAGKEAQKELGAVKIVEVMGDDVSMCQVKSGAKEIKKALEDGLKVIVTSSN